MLLGDHQSNDKSIQQENNGQGERDEEIYLDGQRQRKGERYIGAVSHLVIGIECVTQMFAIWIRWSAWMESLVGPLVSLTIT